MKILLFEDCKDRIANFKNWFKENGITDVTYCHDARDCIKHLHSEKFDLIFLDHDMERVEHAEEYSQHIHSGTVVASTWDHENNKNKVGVPIIIHSVNSERAEFMNKNIPNSILIRRIYHGNIFENLLNLAKTLMFYKIGEVK